MIQPIRRALIVLVATLAACSGRAEAHEGWGIVVQPDGTVYFADIPTNTIWRITPAGLLEVAARDKHSHALVRTPDGSVYGTNEHTPQRPGHVWRIYLTDGNRLRRVLSDGTVTAIAGPFSAPSFGEDAMGVEVETTGMMYVADYSGRRLLRVQPDGVFASALETGWLWAPTGIARHDHASYLLEHLRMPLVILGSRRRALRACPSGEHRWGR